MVWYETFPAVFQTDFTPRHFFMLWGPDVYFHLCLAYKEVGVSFPTKVFVEGDFTGRMF